MTLLNTVCPESYKTILEGIKMKITILQGSARKKGNTARVLAWVEKELIDLGHDVDSIYLELNNAMLSAVAEPAQLLLNDPAGAATAACEELQGGRLLVMSDEIGADSHTNRVDNRQFVNQVFDWLARRYTWFTLTPEEGVVPASGSAAIEVNMSTDRW